MSGKEIIYNRLLELKTFTEFKSKLKYFKIQKTTGDFVFSYHLVANFQYDKVYRIIPSFQITNKSLNKTFLKFNRREDLRKSIKVFSVLRGNSTSIQKKMIGLNSSHCLEDAYEVNLDNQSSLDSLIFQLELEFKNFGIPFFEKFGSLNALNICLNSNLSQHIPFQPSSPFRIIFGLLIALELKKKNLLELKRDYLNLYNLSDFGKHHAIWTKDCFKFIEETILQQSPNSEG